MTTVLPQTSPTVLCKEMDEGAVLFCSRTEVYFGLNPVGLFIWRFLEAGESTFTELVDALRDEYAEVDPADIREDAREFLDVMVEADLVVGSDADPSAG